MFQNVLGSSSPSFLVIVLCCCLSVWVGIGSLSVFRVHGRQKLQGAESRKEDCELGQQQKPEP